MLHALPWTGRGPQLAAWATAPARTQGKFALLLNRNARSVTDARLTRLAAIVGKQHIFASRSLVEAEAMVRHVVDEGYGVVACGGGDGTLADAVNRVARHVARKRRQQGLAPGLGALPTFAFVPLGTGNALKHVVHSQNVEVELAALARGQAFATRTLPLIEDVSDQKNAVGAAAAAAADSMGPLFFFGGMGYDSLLLHDYNRLLEEPRPKWADPWVRSLVGYLTALGRDTLPKVIRGLAPLQLRVTSALPAYRYDPRQNDALVPCPAGVPLYAGEATMLGVGVVPYFGYGLRIFPFADRLPGAMQLRIAKIKAPTALAQLHAIWRGSYRNPEGLLDFAVRQLDVTLASPFPFERDGDDRGVLKQLSLRMARAELRLIDYAQPLPSLPSQTATHLPQAWPGPGLQPRCVHN